MNILIFGDKGYLGSYLKDELGAYIKPCRLYDYIINCAGLVSVELAESDPAKSFNSNVQVVLDLIKNYPSSKLIHFSSYYVYDSNKICDEYARTTDAYYYMKHKLLSERHALTAGGICFRLGKLYGHYDLSKQSRLTEHIIKSSEDIILDNVGFNPTSLNTIVGVLKHEFKYRDLSGLYNLSDDGTSTHYLYGSYILNKLGIENKIQHIDKIKKIFHNYGRFTMNIDKIKKVMPIWQWTDRMDEYLRGIKNA
jgi:dTDP-4-dehydrorhamnose reductase